MNKSGSAGAVFLCLLLAAAWPAWARVDAQVDRAQVYLGDSLRLTLSATEGENIDDADLGAISADFDILERSSSSNFSIVNGQTSSTQELRLELSPKRTGELRIPALEIDGQRTRELRVLVSEPPELDTGGQAVLFEAEIDRDSVYVQGQLILTMRLSQAINLDGRSISELELDNAFVKPLEQSSFQRRIDGRPWLVHEVRYAIFPEQSGTLVIPAQEFSGRVREARRSLFDTGRGRLVRRQSEPLAVTVLPRPADYPAATWLPARRVDLIEEWSVPPEQLRAGESVTRTVRIVGEGLQGAQLPPVRFAPVAGIKFYPDQPQISDREVTSGLQGVRTDSAAIVPTRAGSYEIPELRIPWWDTEREQLRYAVLAGRTLNVAAAPAAEPVTAAVDPTAQALPSPGTPSRGGDATLWRALAIIAACGWLATLVALWHTRRPTRTGTATRERAGANERERLRALQKACTDNDPVAARAACLDWASARAGGAPMTTLEAVADYCGDADLRRELGRLDAALYGSATAQWHGAALARCVHRLRRNARAGAVRGTELQLYPTPEH